jgi:hypothetical protein
LSLEVIFLCLHADGIHKRKRIGCFIHRLVSHGLESVVAYEFDILDHELAVHADELDGDAVRDELGLQINGLSKYLLHLLLAELVLQFGVKQYPELSVYRFVPADEHICKAEAVAHETSAFEPENSTEARTEKNTLNDYERKEALGEASV